MNPRQSRRAPTRSSHAALVHRGPGAHAAVASHGPSPIHSAPNAALLIDFDNVTMGIRSDLQTIVEATEHLAEFTGPAVGGLPECGGRLRGIARAHQCGEIALTYPEGLRIGNFTDGGTPFADEAYRVENGNNITEFSLVVSLLP